MPMYKYTPRGVCSMEIRFGIDEGKLHDVRFLGGCMGNLAAIGKLVEGADAKEIADKLKGNQCGNRPTSCADQFANGIYAALEQPLEQQ